MSTIPGTIQGSSPETFPQVDRSCDGTETDHYMELDADTGVERPKPAPTNLRSTKNDLRHNPLRHSRIAMMILDIEFLILFIVPNLHSFDDCHFVLAYTSLDNFLKVYEIEVHKNVSSGSIFFFRSTFWHNTTYICSILIDRNHT